MDQSLQKNKIKLQKKKVEHRMGQKMALKKVGAPNSP
jgi:hypothetical protein